MTTAAAARLLFEAPITFDVPGSTVHCPMVWCRVAGVETLLILDSGSTDHVLTRELTDRAGLGAEPGQDGTDHAGAPVPSWTLGNVDAAISDVPLVLRNAVAFDGPPAFAGWGVGGFLSPQHLHETAFIVIDLSHDSLVAVEGDAAAVSAWLTSRYPDLRPLEVKREPGELVVIEASVAGSQPIRAQINTGTDLTEVSPHAAGGLRGTAPLEIGYGVSGTEVEGEHATGQTLRVSDWEWPVPRVLTREQPPCDDGAPPLQAQVGMDLLRATVLAVSADRSLPVLWLVPPGEA